MDEAATSYPSSAPPPGRHVRGCRAPVGAIDLIWIPSWPPFFTTNNAAVFAGCPTSCCCMVMQRLDLLGIQCLRRACRLFLRLYSSSEFSSTHSPVARNYSYNYGWLDPWQQPCIKQWSMEHLRPLLARDINRYCNELPGGTPQPKLAEEGRPTPPPRLCTAQAAGSTIQGLYFQPASDNRPVPHRGSASGTRDSCVSASTTF